MANRSLALCTLCATIFLALIRCNVSAPPPSTLSSLFLRSLSLGEGRIVNGTEAMQNNTMHQASIRDRTADSKVFGSGHRCGGSLISDNVVLAGAVCFLEQSNKNGTYADDAFFSVVMGNLDRYQKDNNTLVFNIKKVVKYKEIFDMSTFLHDIVLVILDGAVSADHPTVKPISLHGDHIDDYTICQLTGWGATIEFGNATQFLMTVDLPIVPHDICVIGTLHGTHLREGMFCAGYLEGGRGPCTNDVGDPLVCNGLQSGLVSWGFGCAEPKAPAVFTDVAFYKDWILSKAAEHNGTLPTFVGVNEGGNGSTGGGGENGTTGDNDDDGGGDGTMSTHKNSIVLAILMVVFNVILSKL